MFRQTIFAVASSLVLFPACGEEPGPDSKSVETLAAELRDADPVVRRVASHELARRADESAIEPVVAALADDDETVRENAARGLGRIGLAAVGPISAARAKAGEDAAGPYDLALAAVSEGLSEEALVEALGSPDRSVRVFALDRLPEPRDPRAVDPLIALAADEEALVRILAIRGMGGLGDARAFDRLVERLSSDPDEAVRGEAALALSALGDGRAIEPLLAALARPGESERARGDTISALGWLRDARAEPALAALLEDGTYGERAASALGAIGEPAIDSLVEALRRGSDEYPGAIGRALEAIGPGAVDPLVAMVESGRYPASVRAMKVLGGIGSPRGAPPLLALLERGGPGDRRHAAAALEGIDDPAVEAALLARFEGGDLVTVAAAHRFFVRRGAEGSETLILEALRREGTAEMAETLLNCGHSELAQGARAWALREGYEIHEFPSGGGGGTSWGGR